MDTKKMGIGVGLIVLLGVVLFFFVSRKVSYKYVPDTVDFVVVINDLPGVFLDLGVVESVSSNGIKLSKELQSLVQPYLDEIKEDAMDSDEEDTLQVQNNYNLGDMDFAHIS